MPRHTGLFYTLILVRLGGRRIFGKHTSFDIVLGVILGSIMSRALTANARFIPTLAAATALVVRHRLLSELAFRSPALGHLIKGPEVLIIRGGEPQPEAMKRTKLTEHDLMEGLRTSGGTDDFGTVGAAHLERNGDISVISR